MTLNDGGNATVFIVTPVTDGDAPGC